MKKYQSFLSENVQFLEVKFSTYLNRHVFVMICKHGMWLFVPYLSLILEQLNSLPLGKTHLFKYIEKFTTKN